MIEQSTILREEIIPARKKAFLTLRVSIHNIQIDAAGGIYVPSLPDTTRALLHDDFIEDKLMEFTGVHYIGVGVAQLEVAWSTRITLKHLYDLLMCNPAIDSATSAESFDSSNRDSYVRAYAHGWDDEYHVKGWIGFTVERQSPPQANL
uniref:hypothetical protein n=1 Tax=Cupriavidus taiwanensis TaxID=164546 RepID=UPI003F492E8A